MDQQVRKLAAVWVAIPAMPFPIPTNASVAMRNCDKMLKIPEVPEESRPERGSSRKRILGFVGSSTAIVSFFATSNVFPVKDLHDIFKEGVLSFHKCISEEFSHLWREILWAEALATIEYECITLLSFKTHV
ncbi:hypothetical protein EJB05_24279, partial [Eragrostis curvula]